MKGMQLKPKFAIYSGDGTGATPLSTKRTGDYSLSKPIE